MGKVPFHGPLPLSYVANEESRVKEEVVIRKMRFQNHPSHQFFEILYIFEVHTSEQRTTSVYHACEELSTAIF